MTPRQQRSNLPLSFGRVHPASFTSNIERNDITLSAAQPWSTGSRHSFGLTPVQTERPSHWPNESLCFATRHDAPNASGSAYIAKIRRSTRLNKRCPSPQWSGVCFTACEDKKRDLLTKSRISSFLHRKACAKIRQR